MSDWLTKTRWVGFHAYLSPFFTRPKTPSLRQDVFGKLDLGRKSLDPFGRRAQGERGFYPG
jgi:hypothetical protein